MGKGRNNRWGVLLAAVTSVVPRWAIAQPPSPSAPLPIAPRSAPVREAEPQPASRSSETRLRFTCRIEHPGDGQGGDRRERVTVWRDRDAVVLLHWTVPPSSLAASRSPCQQALQRLRTAQDNDRLDYITLGLVDGQLVLCSVGDRRSGCNRTNVLLSLPRPATRDRPALRLMSDLFELELPEAPPRCDLDETVYVRLRHYLDRDPETPLHCRCECGVCTCEQRPAT